MGHKWCWHYSWWPSGHPEGGSGLSHTIPVLKPWMCSSPEGLVCGVLVLCVTCGFEALSHWAAATSAPWECHPPPSRAGATGWSCLRIHSRASGHLWGSHHGERLRTHSCHPADGICGAVKAPGGNSECRECCIHHLTGLTDGCTGNQQQRLCPLDLPEVGRVRAVCLCRVWHRVRQR